MELDRKKAVLIRAGYFLLIAAAVYIALRWLWRLLLPFLVGFTVAYALQPATDFVSRHSKMSRRSASIVCAVLFYAVVGAVCWLLIAMLLLKAGDAAALLPQFYTERIAPSVTLLSDRLNVLIARYFPNVDAQAAFAAAGDVVSGAFVAASGWGAELVRKLFSAAPMSIVTIVFTIISSVLACADYKGVTGFVMRQIPQRMHKTVLEARDFLAGNVLRIVKTYLILMAITFAELALGLWVLGIKGFVAYAGIIAFVDLLPVLGSGAIMIPWAIVLALIGESYKAIGLGVLWALISVVREVLEPRILGGQIGLHPLAALTAMYFGLRLAGFAGLLIAPLLCLLAVHLHEKGVIKLYRPGIK